jgi:hypothetical protein
LLFFLFQGLLPPICGPICEQIATSSGSGKLLATMVDTAAIPCRTSINRMFPCLSSRDSQKIDKAIWEHVSYGLPHFCPISCVTQDSGNESSSFASHERLRVGCLVCVKAFHKWVTPLLCLMQIRTVTPTWQLPTVLLRCGVGPSTI